MLAKFNNVINMGALDVYKEKTVSTLKQSATKEKILIVSGSVIGGIIGIGFITFIVWKLLTAERPDL